MSRSLAFQRSEKEKAFCRACIPVCEREYPELLEEIRGIADGQNMEMEELAAFILGIYVFAPSSHCTCIAFRRGGQTVFGRNSDFLTALEPYYDSCFYWLEGGYPFIGNTTALVQMEDGVNRHGLAAGLTFVCPTVAKPGLNAGILVRYALEKCRTVKEALAALERLTISSSQTITLADSGGDMAVVECNAKDFVVMRPGPGENFVAAVNEFHSPRMEQYRFAAEDDFHSAERYRVARNALKEKQGGDPLAFAKDLLSGKFGFMCQYDREKGADTVWSSIYLLNGQKSFRCEGNPSRSPYKEDFRLEFEHFCG